jgi:hypothetical protein
MAPPSPPLGAGGWTRGGPTATAPWSSRVVSFTRAQWRLAAGKGHGSQRARGGIGMRASARTTSGTAHGRLSPAPAPHARGIRRGCGGARRPRPRHPFAPPPARPAPSCVRADGALGARRRCRSSRRRRPWRCDPRVRAAERRMEEGRGGALGREEDGERVGVRMARARQRAAAQVFSFSKSNARVQMLPFESLRFRCRESNWGIRRGTRGLRAACCTRVTPPCAARLRRSWYASGPPNGPPEGGSGNTSDPPEGNAGHNVVRSYHYCTDCAVAY